ncbi:MAG: hypothetical protein P9M03_12455 [Candidatus Theseobacter exili]|nr:hypothetical protein [Candidatus Theseobacter exili]
MSNIYNKIRVLMSLDSLLSFTEKTARIAGEIIFKGLLANQEIEEKHLNDFFFSGSILAATPGIHKEILKILNRP